MKEISYYSAVDELADLRLLERTKRLSNEFNAAPDTILFYEGICRAVQLLHGLFPNEPIKMVDIGCNSGIPDMTGIRQGIIQSSLGIELSTEAVRKGERIKRILGINDEQMRFLNLNMLEETAKTGVKNYRPQLVAGNLPYLPALPDSPFEVSGGLDGTQYVPSVILEYASLTEVPVATMSLCSLVNLKKVIEQIEESPYVIQGVLLLNHPFGRYTQQLFQAGLLERMSYTPYFFTDSNKKMHQLVINMILIDRRLSFGNKEFNSNQLIEVMEEYKATGEISFCNKN